MEPESKLARVEDDEAFAKEAPQTLAWLWHNGKAPDTVTYKQLLDISAHMWAADKLCVSEYDHRLFKEYEAKMSPEERAKHEASHRLAQEFELLHLKQRFMKALDWKMRRMTLDELAKWEAEADKE